MEHNRELPQVSEILELLQKAKEYSIKSLERIEKLNAYATQIQGRNAFVQRSLIEQAQVMQILSEQNPELEMLRSSKNRIDEALSHSLALSQLSERNLEILDLSANDAIEQGNITKASSLLKSVIACLDLIAEEKFEAFVQTTICNQNAENEKENLEALNALKTHLKGF